MTPSSAPRLNGTVHLPPGAPAADPLIGLIITLVILPITWDSWQTVRSAEIEIDHFEHRN
ncbi:MAG: hypothetical protein M3O92_03860 [Actinomycetota bacterium]|nr:hypothetical protein [Actinomycetota bacterium]